MGEFSPIHWLVVIVVIMIFFGPGKIPEIAKSLGQGVKEFKKAMKEASDTEETTKPATINKAEPSQQGKAS